MKRLLLIIFVIFLSSVIYHLSSVPILAINMDSSRFHIQFGTLDIGASPKDTGSANYKITTSLGDTAQNEFTSSGYIVKAGFEYIHSIIPFTFSLSKTNIDLGTLIPATPNTDSTILKVSFGAAGQYQVTAVEETPLQTFSGSNTIADTNCDTSCSVSSAGVWNSSAKYGFGYNMSCSGVPSGPPCSSDLPADFVDGTYFRPFADSSTGGQPQVVMSNTNVTEYSDTDSSLRNTHQTAMTFKANISTSQSTGTYQTVINYVATPSY